MRFLAAALDAFRVHNVPFRFIVPLLRRGFSAQSKYWVIERQLGTNTVENGSANSVCM